jgi:hypothetical protein
MSQVVQQEALTRLLVEKGIFTKEKFLKILGKKYESILFNGFSFDLESER